MARHTLKTCTVCKDSKPLDDYYNSKSSKDGKGYRCKPCDSDARQKWAEDNPIREKASRRGRLLKYKYGITLAEYTKMLEDQSRSCAICGCLENSSRVHGSLAVDHCHSTGSVRGLLCNQCNRAIGMLNDDVDLLRSALKYLEKNK
jgi:hypothetical protein